LNDLKLKEEYGRIKSEYGKAREELNDVQAINSRFKEEMTSLSDREHNLQLQLNKLIHANSVLEEVNLVGYSVRMFSHLFGERTMAVFILFEQAYSFYYFSRGMC